MSEQTECLNDNCEKEATRVITKFGGVAPVCDEHAEERLEDPDAVDNTAFFTGERDEPISGPTGGSR